MKDLLVTGGKTGMVGNAIQSYSKDSIFVNSSDCDLRDLNATKELFNKHKPKYVIHLAATVGGVLANTNSVADFYTDNILINTNVLKCAHESGVKKVVSLLSTCVYPDAKYVQYPLTEDQLHLGEPHESNFGYAYAKRMLDVQSRAYNKQYGTNFMCAIPNNIIGIHDNFDLENGHVVPAIIRKVWEAKHNREDVVIWGNGESLREFTSSNDVARSLLFLLWSVDKLDAPVNIGCTKEYSIKQIVNKIVDIMDYNGNVIWDKTKLSGQMRKPSSNKKFEQLGFNINTYTDIDVSLKEVCSWVMREYPNIRGVKI